MPKRYSQIRSKPISFWRRKGLRLLVLVLIILAIPLTVYLGNTEQDLRQHAAEISESQNFGKAAQFYNFEDVYIRGTHVYRLQPPLTIEGWMKPENSSDLGYYIFAFDPTEHDPSCNDRVSFWGVPTVADPYQGRDYRKVHSITVHIYDDDNTNKSSIGDNEPGRTDIPLRLFGHWAYVTLTIDENQVIKFYVDGKLEGQTQSSIPICINASANFSFEKAPQADWMYTGELDEWRISKTVRYQTDFTPPIAPFVIDADTVALWHFDGNATDSVTGASAEETVDYVDSNVLIKHGFTFSPNFVRVTVKRGKKTPALTIASQDATQYEITDSSWFNRNKVSLTPKTGTLTPGQSKQVSVRVDDNIRPGRYAWTAKIKNPSRNVAPLYFPIEVIVKR